MNSSSTTDIHYPVMIIGGGQAGLSVSYYLKEMGLKHLILEKDSLVHGWKNERWDSFTLVTPNWQCDLPGHPYDGDDPKGFMTQKETVAYLERFVDKFKPPVQEGVTVTQVSSDASGLYHVATSHGDFTADQVVVASGGYRIPVIPRMAERIPHEIFQIHSAQYRNARQLPEGSVLVVGSGQSGAQIAEDLHLEDRSVYLATGNAPRVSRRYRGRDVVEWLHDMGYYDISVEDHPLGKDVRSNTNHYVTGRDGGRDIDLRKFALEGMELFGSLTDYSGEDFIFEPNLRTNLDKADNTLNSINARIDAWIDKQGIETEEGASVYSPLWSPRQEFTRLNPSEAGITSIVWCIGFRPDFGWLDAPVFNGRGHPQHQRGVTGQPGLYFIGLPWLHTWGSGRFSGVKRDAEHLVEQIAAYSKAPAPSYSEKATAS